MLRDIGTDKSRQDRSIAPRDAAGHHHVARSTAAMPQLGSGVLVRHHGHGSPFIFDLVNVGLDDSSAWLHDPLTPGPTGGRRSQPWHAARRPPTHRRPS